MVKRRTSRASTGGGISRFNLGGIVPAVVILAVAAAAYLLISRVKASDITDPFNEYVAGLTKYVDDGKQKVWSLVTSGTAAPIDLSIPDLSGLTPGTFQTSPSSPVYQGTGLGNLFVNAGPDSPASFYPLGPVISTSRELSTAEQLQVIQNLQSSGIKDAWWNAGALIAEQDQINAGNVVNQQGHYVCQNKEGWDYVPC